MGNPLTILSVAYPLSPVRADTSGGAEQVLSMIDQALTKAGHTSIVVAQEGSTVSGTLLPVPRFTGPFTADIERQARANHRAAIQDALKRWPVDLVHMHGQDFDSYLPPPGVPVVVTLHVPREWYSQEALSLRRPGTWFHCVSHEQHRTWPEGFGLLPPVENGVPVDLFRLAVRKRCFALALGRICPEKGFHLALDAAARARTPMILGGEVYPYAEHERYFKNEIVSRLRGGPGSRFLGPIGFERKRRLLASARCLLAPSQVAETSSLVAMEALASGTPVIAWPSGALAGIVEHGKTGFLVDNVRDMAQAIEMASKLDPAQCRRAASERFAATRMTSQYVELYRSLLTGSHADQLSFRAPL